MPAFTSIGGKTVWDDLRFPASSVNPPGQASDPDISATNGTLLFDATGTELVFFQVQLPHAWKAGTNIKPHVHWAKTTSAAGNVLWRLNHKIAALGGTFGDFSDDDDALTVVPSFPDTNAANKHLLTSFSEIDMSGIDTVSAMLLIKLSRVGGDAADTYGADAELFEFDIHYEIDQIGSREEYTK